jgi:Ca2+-binding RTX toxin-like protein
MAGGTGADTLIGKNVASTWSVTGPNSGQVGDFTFKGVENLTGGTANDTFRFSAAGSVAGKIDGGGGINTLDYSAVSTPAAVNLASNAATRTGGILDIRAMLGSPVAGDRLIGSNVANTWKITADNVGTVNGSFSFNGVENLTGGTVVDVFQLADGAGVSGRLDGGGGGDWLDFSAYTTPVKVNLTLGTATSVAGGVANVRNVFGGAAGNTLTGSAVGSILVGGVGVDTITGGTGRSILIGGKGADKVIGGAADDVLIGGSTSFDRNAAALASVLAEWQSAKAYAQRINSLKLGGGLNGSNRLIVGSTVIDDFAADILTGGGGTDWFVEHPTDYVTDLSASEIVN